jgi:hypothetical protein
MMKCAEKRKVTAFSMCVHLACEGELSYFLPAKLGKGNLAMGLRARRIWKAGRSVIFYIS